MFGTQNLFKCIAFEHIENSGLFTAPLASGRNRHVI